VTLRARSFAKLGAKVIREVEESGYQWVILSDPEGNEFCVFVT
jgi:predicted enzyme related to lactoylglutathione lyase